MTITAKWVPDGTTPYAQLDPDTDPGYVELALEDGRWELDSASVNEKICGGSYNASAFTEAIPGSFVSLDDANVAIQTAWEAACASQLVRFSLENGPIVFLVGDEEVEVPLEVARSKDFDEENL